ncbi:MAG: DUF4114 domain-containing protein [Planctomycetes bacterium]|nr:DUF4114 domain-containing protein [Planctomycetota bacterium]
MRDSGSGLAPACAIELLEQRTLLSQIGNVTVGPQVDALTYGTVSSTTYEVTVLRGNTAGAFVADLNLSTTLPANVSGAFTAEKLTFAVGDISLTTFYVVTALPGAQATPAPAGFTISASVEGNAQDTASGDGSVQIDRKALTVSLVAADKTYDGLTDASITQADLNGVLAGDDVTLIDGTATFDTKSAGQGKTVTDNGLSLSGTDAANYSLPSTATTTASINRLALTETITINDKTYDGLTTASIASATLTGVLANDDVSLTGGTAQFETATAGSGKPVHVTGLTLTGQDAANYSASSTADTTGKILKRLLTAAITVSDKTYDGTLAGTITDRALTGIVNNDDVSLTGGSATFASKTVGIGKTVTVTGLSLTGTAAANYTVADTATTSASINALTLAPVIVVANKTYDGTTTAVVSLQTLDGVISDDDVSLTGAVATFSTPNAGTGKTVNVTGLTLTGTDAGNYSVSPTTTTTANINALELTPVITVADKTYDGTTSATITGKSLPGTIADDDVTLAGGVAAFVTPGAGAGKTVNITGLTLAGADAGNYTLTSPVTSTASINAAALKVTADNLSVNVGGNLPTLTVSYSGFVNGETLATSDVTGTPSVTTTATSTATAGKFPITATVGTLTSTNYTFSFVAGTLTIVPVTPTGLALTSETLYGAVVTPAPVFTATAGAGVTVTYLVNGTTTVTTTESAPGTYTATLTRQMLQIGANTITATATSNSVSSAASAAVNFVYAPSESQVYTVAGAFGSAQTLTFNWTSRDASYHDELGVFTVDDLTGTVGGVAPGSAGYAAAALGSSSRTVIFSSGQTAGASRTITVTGGQLLAFYLISNNTTSVFLERNGDNRLTGLNAFFSVKAANPDRVQHVITTGDPQTGRAVMGWEDLLFGGDRDYNDIVISLTPGSAVSPTVGSALRVPGVTGNDVPLTMSLEPTRRAADSTLAAPARTAPGEIGYFVVSDSAGTVAGLAPGDTGYVAAALENREVLFQSGDSLQDAKTVQAPGGALLGFYYIPGSTAAQVLATNPQNLASNTPIVLFSFAAANPDRVQHFRWSAPEAVSVPVLSQSTDQYTQFLHAVGKLNPRSVDFDDFLLSLTIPQ